MPNRIIKESVCVSEEINSLSPFEEVLFYRLIVNCDDYGRFDGRAAILKGRLFPLRAIVTEDDIKNALNALAAAGLVFLYEAEGREYIQLKSWAKHQNIRAKKAKYPGPGEACETSDIKCDQMISDVPVIQSESEYISLSLSVSEPASESEYESLSVFVSEPASISETREEDVLKTYENLFGNSTERVSDMLESFDLPSELKIFAIKEAYDNNARAPIRYIEAVLKRYAQENVKSVNEVQGQRQSKKYRSAESLTYDWEAIEREDQLRLKRNFEKICERERKEREEELNAKGNLP